MDLLDGIEDISTGATTYRRNINLQLQPEEELDEVPTQEESTQNDVGDDFDDGNSKVPDVFSRINLIKSRIQGKVLERNDFELDFGLDSSTNIDQPFTNLLGLDIGSKDEKTSDNNSIEVQKLPQLPVELDDYTQNNSSLFDPTQKIANDTQRVGNLDESTQNIDQSTQYDATQRIGLQSTPADNQSLQNLSDATQVIRKSAPESIDKLFLSDSDDDDAKVVIPLTKEQRQEKIAKLAELKRQERLERDLQLEQEISKTTLTDEENDLNDYNDSVVSNINPTDKTSLKELQQAEEFINIQKRHLDIRPEFVKKSSMFTRDKLISAFDSDEEVNVMDNKGGSTPITSPVQQSETKPNFKLELMDDSSDEEEELNIFDLMNSKPKQSKPVQASKNSFLAYAQKIKQSTNEKNEFVLDDSDSDSGLESVAVPSTSKFSNDGKELNKIPELLKEQRLVLQQKFLKKNFHDKNKPGTFPSTVKNLMVASNGNDSHAKSIEFHQFFKNLKKTNIEQLQAHKLSNPDNAIIQEMEKDEEVMGTLLEREMERARKIRKQEKLRERAKLALLKKGSGEVDQEVDVEVPDSDFEVQESDYHSDSEHENEVGNNAAIDDEAEEDDDDESEDDENNDRVNLGESDKENIDAGLSIDGKILGISRNDDSYMFEGGNSDSDAIGIDEEGVVASSQPSVNNEPQTSDEQFVRAESGVKLFANLQPRLEKAQTQNLLFDLDTANSTQDPEVLGLSFNDINVTATPIDEPTQVDSSTQIDVNHEIKKDYVDDDEDDVITPAAVQNGRKKVRSNKLEKLPEEIEDDEEELKQKIKLYEAKIRKQELALRKRRRDLERKGVKNVVEGEAVESEDEWRGLGGMEGELSEEANSEDEKMIDNDFNIDLKDDEIRQKFMDEYQIKDQKQLEKLLDDIKNHRLTKRAAANGLDIEFSDKEDELLMAYRRQKRTEQLQRLQENKSLLDSLKNNKQKAFFDSMQEKESLILIDDDDDDDFVEEEEAHKENASDDEDELETVAPLRKKFKIEESFVQKKLSFLMESLEDNYSQIQRRSRIQHDVNSSDDEIEDLQALKSRSMASLVSLSARRSESPVTVSNEALVETDADEEDEHDEFLPAFKKRSMVQSFKSFNENQNHGISEGKHFSGVTVNKQYKVAMGSKSSISYLSKNKSQRVTIKTAKEQKLERSLTESKKFRSRVFTSTGFE